MDSTTTSQDVNIKQEIVKDSVNPVPVDEGVTTTQPAPEPDVTIKLCLACGLPVVSTPSERSQLEELEPEPNNSNCTLTLRCFLKLFGGARKIEMDHQEQLSFCSLCNQELLFLMDVQQKLKELQKALQRGTKEMRQKLEVSESRFQSAQIYERDERFYKIRRRILGDKIVLRNRREDPARQTDSETETCDANLSSRKSSDFLEAKQPEIRRSGRSTKGKSKLWKLNTSESERARVKVDSEHESPVPVVKVSATEKADADKLIPEHIKVEVDIEDMVDEEDPFEEDPCDEDYSPEGSIFEANSESESEHSENSDNDNMDYSDPGSDDDDNYSPPQTSKSPSTKKQGRTKRSGPKQPLVCSYCEKGFKTSDKLKRHVMTHTGERPNKCSYCEKAFIRSTSLRHHIMRIHQNDRPHQCSHCECAYSTKDHLSRHLFRTHGIEKEVSSSKSGRSSAHPPKEKKPKLDDEAKERARFRKRTAKGIYNTEKVKDDPGTGNCQYLEVDFEKFEENKYRCLLCAEIVTSHATIKNHVIRAHTDRFVCDRCGQHKASRSDLNKHIREVHEGKPRKPIVKKKVCHICGKPFGHKSALEFHLVTHYSEEEKREVEARGEKLKTQGKRVQCGVCGAVFNSVTWLKIHEKTKHPVTESDKAEFQRVCPHCGKSFSEAYFGRHMERYHSGVDPDLLKSFACSYCDRKFFTSQKLHNHRKIHTGERPFSCELCNKAFTTKVLLKHHHMRNHENRRPHKCHLCQAAFITKDHLNRHVAGVHEGKKQQTKTVYQHASEIEQDTKVNLDQFLE